MTDPRLSSRAGVAIRLALGGELTDQRWNDLEGYLEAMDDDQLEELARAASSVHSAAGVVLGRRHS